MLLHYACAIFTCVVRLGHRVETDQSLSRHHFRREEPADAPGDGAGAHVDPLEAHGGPGRDHEPVAAALREREGVEETVEVGKVADDEEILRLREKMNEILVTHTGQDLEKIKRIQLQKLSNI